MAIRLAAAFFSSEDRDGRNWNPQQLHSARGGQIFLLSYASPPEGLERVVKNFIVFHIPIMHCTQVQNIMNYNFVLLVEN